MLNRSLTISIPAYNDKDSLEKMVAELTEFLRDASTPADILIVNDGSSDGTHVVARKLRDRYSFVQVITHSNNEGFGKTLKEVFSVPKTDWVIFLPGDNQFPAANLGIFMPLMDHFDYIIGYRRFRNDSLHRKFYSKLYNFLLRIMLGIEAKDVNSVVAFRQKFLEGYVWKSNSAFVHAELYLHMKNNGARIYETEVIHQAREYGFGSGGNIGVILSTLYDFSKYSLKNIKWFR